MSNKCLVGFTMPNRQWEAWTQEEVDAAIDLHPGVIQVNYYEQQPAPVREAQRLQIGYIYQAIKCRFQYRMYGWHDMIACAAASSNLVGYPEGSICPFNEPNVPLEGWWQDVKSWREAAEQFSRRYAGMRELVTPALSPNYPLYHEGIARMAELVKAGKYQYLGLHCYSPSDDSAYGDLPVCITECHGHTVTEVFNRLCRLPTVKEVVWFSLKWHNPDIGYFHDLLGNSDLYQQFKEWKGVTMPEFKLGFRDLANKLGADVVGEPLEDEWSSVLVNKARSLQQTTKGMLVWVDGEPCRFLTDCQVPPTPPLDIIDLREVLPKLSLYPTRPLSAIERIVIHYTGDVHVDSTAWSIARYHTQTKQWPGIGYHYLVHWDSSIEYVGSISTVRYHVGGLDNFDTVGICLPGCWSEGRIPPDVTLASTRALIRHIYEGLGRTLPIYGHKEIKATACPGDTWEQWKDRLL